MESSSVKVENKKIESAPKEKFDPKSPLWKYVTIVGKIQGGGSLIWVCSECQKEFKASYTRVKAHLLGIKNNGIRVCSGPPKLDGTDGRGLSKEKIAKYKKEQNEADAKANESNDAFQFKQPTMLGASSSRAPFPSHEISNPSPKRSNLGPLEKSFNNDARATTDEAISRCIYANGLPFNLVRSPYWAEMLKAVNEAPKGYKGPGYEQVRTTLLTGEKLRLEGELNPIHNSWRISGVSIISYGWKDQRNRPLINVIAQNPNKTMFLKAVDCEGENKDAQFIAEILIEAIELVGAENVVQVITDNSTVCRAAGLIVEGKYQHIFWTPCAVHSLNLMLCKLGTQIRWIQLIFEEAKEIQAFITNHHMSQGIYREFAKLELLKVAETHFASHIIVLMRLMQVKDALHSMVCSSLWNQWRQFQTERARVVKRMVVDDEWWDRVEYLLAFTKPIVDLLRMFDTDRPSLGEVYEGINSMIEKIRVVINAKEQDPNEIFYKEVKDILTKKWNKMTTPLHLLAYAMNPKYYSVELLSDPERTAPNKDPKVSQGFKKAFRKLFVDLDIGVHIRTEFAHFLGSECLGADIEAMRDKTRLTPIHWWNFHGGEIPNIQKLAIRILSQVASSSSAERNWSTYGFIYSVKRNKLGSKKAEELVYVHSNLRLLSHKKDEYKLGPTKLWDVEPELPDLDMTLSAMSHMNLFDDVAPTVASSSGHGSNAPTTREDGNADIDLCYMDEDIFDDM